MDLSIRTQVERILEGFALYIAMYVFGSVLTSLLGGFPIAGYVFMPADGMGWVKLVATYWATGWLMFLIVEYINVKRQGRLF